jgi:hypothetical protein
MIIARIENSTPFFNEIDPYPVPGESESDGKWAKFG